MFFLAWIDKADYQFWNHGPGVAIMILFGLLALIVPKSPRLPAAQPGGPPNETRLGPSLMPEVAAFLNSHHNFGTLTSTQDVPNWAKGKRQRVNFDSGRSLLFYMKDGEVVTVYEDHPSEGRKKVWGEYDQPEITKPVDRPPTDALPAYRVLFSAQKLGSGKFGDILIPSLSRTTPASEREAIARRIAQQEWLTEICIYSSEEAYKANISASCLKQHPDALKKGFLGSIRDGKFTPGESVFPKDAEKGQTERKATQTSATTLLRMGQALERKGRLKPALEYYQRLVKEYPDAPEANTARTRIEELTKP